VIFAKGDLIGDLPELDPGKFLGVADYLGRGHLPNFLIKQEAIKQPLDTVNPKRSDPCRAPD
jgi:hypothetical protein